MKTLATYVLGTLAFVAGAVGSWWAGPDPHAPGTGPPGVVADPGTWPGRLLGYDPRGDGQVVLSFGDLGAARHVAVVVPGTGWTAARLRDAAATPVAGARDLVAEANRLDPATPTTAVLWFGYDAPESIDREVMRSTRAVAGARALTRFLAGLPAGTRVSLVCHSYGAVVCGRAVTGGAHVDDLVAVAAPGLDVGSAAGLRTRVWAARTADDPIRYTPFVRLAGLGHDADPTSHGFGARVLRTGTAHGHGGYFRPGTESLTNLARITLGRTGEVTVRG